MTDPALLPVLQKLVPQKDGEPYTVHRSAVVDAVNADGTVDLVLSGVTVPGVPVLGGAGVWVGGTVSVLAWQGALLVLGSTQSAPGDTGWVDVTVETGFTGVNGPAVRRIGRAIYFKGYISGSFTANVTTTIGYVVGGFRPPANDGRAQGSGTTNGGLIAQYMAVTAAGVLQVRVGTTGTHIIPLGGMSGYLVD